MSTLRLLWVACVIAALHSTGLAQLGDPLDLGVRVKEAEVIVVGKLQPEYTVSKHLSGGHVEIEQVLLGTVTTNKPLTVQYACDERFIPGMISSTHTINRTNKYICFLNSGPAAQGSNRTVVLVPVGKRRLACDGFELLTGRALEETKNLIAERTKKEGNRLTNGSSQ